MCVCGYAGAGVRVCGHVGMLVCGRVRVRVCGCARAGVRVYGCVGVCPSVIKKGGRSRDSVR